MKKKVLALTIVCIISSAFITGCGGNDQPMIDNRSVTVTPTVDDVVAAQIAQEDAERAGETVGDAPAIISYEPEKASTYSASDNSASENTVTEEERQTGVADGAPEPESVSDDTVLSTAEGVDVDLTTMSTTMIYTEVYNMMYIPEDYFNKTIKVNGEFVVYYDVTTKNTYYYCKIQDATACCTLGIEFRLAGDAVYPDDYPPEGTQITVVGTYMLYLENGYKYTALMDAELVE